LQAEATGAAAGKPIFAPLDDRSRGIANDISYPIADPGLIAHDIHEGSVQELRVPTRQVQLVEFDNSANIPNGTC
jgi:hypothetical protein